jgi:hypothetical protein
LVLCVGKRDVAGVQQQTQERCFACNKSARNPQRPRQLTSSIAGNKQRELGAAELALLGVHGRRSTTDWP